MIVKYYKIYTGKTKKKKCPLEYVVMPETTDIRVIDAMKLIHKVIRDKKTMPVDVVVSKKTSLINAYFRKTDCTGRGCAVWITMRNSLKLYIELKLNYVEDESEVFRFV